MTGYCDIYLFCLWHESKPWWERIVDRLTHEYGMTMMFKSCFPNDMELARRFYDNERLLGGYGKKLDGMRDEFVFCVCKDKEMNNIVKLLELKHELRGWRGIKDDFNFIHASQTI